MRSKGSTLIYNMILAIETSSNVCGISLVENGKIITDLDEPCHREHNERLPLLVQSMLKNNTNHMDHIKAIAINIGPGSFTGLRIGLGFAKGIAYSKEIPIIPVPSMLALAFSLRKYSPQNGIMSSHADKVFYQNFKWENSLPIEMSPPESGILSDYINRLKNGFQSNCADLIRSNIKVKEALPSAKNIGLLASIFSDKWKVKKPFDLAPNYVNDFKV